MTVALRGALGALAACALFATIQTASAGPSCPAGQAIQSIDGKKVICASIPDVSALQGRIDAEATSRAGMDATLLQGVQDEARDRKAADEALRATINEANIVGTYAFSGPTLCLSSSTGFNSDLTPRAATTGSAVIIQLIGISSGTRTFNADGTGTAEITTYSINPPFEFYASTGATGLAFNNASPNPSGGASMAVQRGTFTWEIADGKLYMADNGATGTITKGGTRVGWAVDIENLPRSVAILGKDLRSFTSTHDDVQVETGVQTSPDKSIVSRTDRVCSRQRTFHKL
jgi:hypothetical protein